METCRAAAALLLLLSLSSPARADSIEDLRKTLERTAKSGYVSDQRERERAVRRLGDLGSLGAAELLAECLGDPLPQIRNMSARALGSMSKSRDRDAAADCVARRALWDRQSEERRIHAARALGLMGSAGSQEHLRRVFAHDPSAAVRAEAARALGLLGDQGAADVLAKGLSRNDESAGQAALALGRLGAAGSAAALRKAAAAGAHWTARAHAIDALALLGSRDLGAACIECLGRDRDFRPRIAAVEALAAAAAMEEGPSSGAAFAVSALARALEDRAWQVCAAAVETSVGVWDVRCVDMLVEFLRRAEGSRLMVDAVGALTVYLGRDMGYFHQSWKGWWESNRAGFKLGPRPERGALGVFECGKSSGEPPEKKPTQSEFFSMPVFSRSFAFLFDFSGSMSFGSLGRDRGVPKIKIARERFEQCVAKLGQDARFNVYIYREDFKWPVKRWMEAFQNDLVPAVPVYRGLASMWVREAEVKGRGPFYDGLVLVTENPRIDTVFLLADGEPSSGSHTEKDDFVEAWSAENRFRKVMICPVVIGSSGTNVGLMKDLARSTGGFYMHHKGE